MKKGISSLIIVAIVISVAVVSFLLFKSNQFPVSEKTAEMPGTSNQISTESSKKMTFLVTVPENTPEEDIVYIYIAELKGVTKHKMEKTGRFTHEISLDAGEIDAAADENGNIKYRYSRNGWNFNTAEYLEPDTNDYFWTELGRKTKVGNGKLQKDAVGRWRWFPQEGLPPRTTDIEPEGEFLPRVNGAEFRSGQVIEDLYVDAFHEFFDSTSVHLKSQGYSWVELDPPWQWTEVAGFPRVSNEIENNPNYPDDETFLEELRAYKKQGLKVFVAPQVCCNPIDTRNRSHDWWDAYFNETEKFLLHFAKLSEEGGADAFYYAVSSSEFDNLEIEIDIEQKWRKIWRNVKSIFSGEVGQMLWVLGPNVSPSPSPIPDTSFVTWGDELDFFYVSTEFPLSTNDNPTDEELEKRAGEIIDGVKSFYDKYNKPMVVRNGYFNVRYSWKGQSFYQINSVPWIGDSESKLKESIYEFDTTDHTRTINAYFKAIAERPWVIGYVHFGYTHWEDPLSPWMSVRGKPAEDLWRKWNEVIFS